MFRLDRKTLGTPCALCRFNANHKRLAMLPGTSIFCNKKVTPFGRQLPRVCEMFELNIDMLEHVVYNQIAFALNANTACLITPEGFLRKAHSPLHILIAGYEQDLACTSFRKELHGNTKPFRDCITITKTVIDNKLATLSNHDQSAAAAYINSGLMYAVCPQFRTTMGLSGMIAKNEVTYSLAKGDVDRSSITNYVHELLSKKNLV